MINNKAVSKKEITNTVNMILILPIIITLNVQQTFSQKKVNGILYSDGTPVSVEIENGIIKSITQLTELSENKNDQVYIAPGFFDNQVNGYSGVSFIQGDLTVDSVRKVTESLWAKGVTTYLPTLTTNSYELILKNLEVIAQAKEDTNLLGSVPGVHLEGPYISPVDGYRGAHPEKYVEQPNWDKFLKLYDASQQSIITITVAPEIEGVMDLIQKCSDAGITVALGHHNGNAQQIDEAVEKGAKISTHFGNGCANSINHHLNPLWPQLANDSLLLSIICDGFHLSPEEIKVFYKVKGTDKTIITSDVTKFGGMKPGIYKNEIGDDIELTPEGNVQYPAQKVLAGSASSIDKGISHIMKITGCPLSDAIQMASTNPAKLYGMNDRGTIEVGKRADLVLFSLRQSKIKIEKTFVKGELVYDSNR